MLMIEIIKSTTPEEYIGIEMYTPYLAEEHSILQPLKAFCNLTKAYLLNYLYVMKTSYSWSVLG